MMKYLKIFIFTFIFLLLFKVNLFAGVDWELWNKYNLDVKFSKLFSLRIEPELRLKENFTEFYYNQIYIGIGFKPFEWLRVSTMYDYKRSKAKYNWNTEDIGVYDIELLKLPFILGSIFDYRLRTEYNFTKQECVLRNRFKVSKNYSNLKGITIFTWEETFYSFLTDKFNESRTAIGISKKINTNLSISLAYILRYRLSTFNKWYNTNILDIEATINF